MARISVSLGGKQSRSASKDDEWLTFFAQICVVMWCDTKLYAAIRMGRCKRGSILGEAGLGLVLLGESGRQQICQ